MILRVSEKLPDADSTSECSHRGTNQKVRIKMSTLFGNEPNVDGQGTTKE